VLRGSRWVGFWRRSQQVLSRITLLSSSEFSRCDMPYRRPYSNRLRFDGLRVSLIRTRTFSIARLLSDR
jgi:hypothetical protein